ncbi:MAG: glycosyltransferase family 2 protein [Promethearchaeota archaeon]
MQVSHPSISIIFPSYNGVKFLERNLNSIKSLDNLDEIELIIIDNKSKDSSIKVINSFENYINIKLVKNKCNEGFAEACNCGVINADGDFVFITNQDVVFPPDFFSKLKNLYFKYKKNLEIVISPALVFENGRIHYFGAKNHFLGFSYTPELGEKLPKNKILKITQRFSGGTLFIKKSYFLEMGGFEKEYFMYYEDTDLSLKMMNNGNMILTTNDPYLIHQKKSQNMNKLQYFFLERNRYLILLKNVDNLSKLLPIIILTEFILLFHSLFLRKFRLRLRIYMELLKKIKCYRKLREKAKKENKLIPYQSLSRTLDPILLGKLAKLNVFKKLLHLFNRLLKFI